MNTTKVGLQRVTFPVADVTPATERLAATEMSAAMERTVRSKLIACPRTNQQVVDVGDFHPLVAAAALAYQKHFPLVLTPDMIWLTILQGVAQHLANHSEALREKLVAHQTKIELIVERTELPTSDALMLSATREFTKQITKHVVPEKRFLLHTEFSTTTDVERIAGAIVVMDAFQPYFDYVFAIICGIPSVTLEGSTTDWEMLGGKVRSLHESNLELSWWTKHLLPLCDQFVRASRGDVDKKHWNNLCKLVERYGVDDLNGWLLKFIPYVRKEKNERPIHRNPVLELTEFPADKEIHGPITGCTSNMLPTGLSKAPVTCVFRGIGGKPDLHMELQFIAGFAGVTQDKEDFSLRPLIGWAIAEPALIDQCIKRLHLDHGARRPVSRDTEQIREAFSEYLPADLWRLYSEVDGAAIRSSENLVCRLLPLTEVRPACSLHDLLLDLSNRYERQQIKDPEEYHRLRQWVAPRYADLVRIAELSDGTSIVVGRDPESRPRLGGGRMEIFRWTGEAKIEAFDPVAPTITAWLEKLLRSELAPH